MSRGSRGNQGQGRRQPQGNRNGRRPRRQPRPANRSNGTRVLATGVGATVPRPFGGDRQAYSLKCWDAKHPSHLPLPRAVGPYTTIRATRRVQVSTRANIIGTFQEGSISAIEQGNWSEVVMVSDLNPGNLINSATANAQTTTVDLSGLGEAATLVPAALTVQIMCPTALQTASGIIYAGVMNTQAAIGGRTDTWTDYMDKFVQFQNPRLLAASKLALRGVEINSYPLNMTEVSKFTALQKVSDSSYVYSKDRAEPVGWAPIVVYNPGGAVMELLITVEYRVRFDLDHPASGSHSHHPVASDSVWDKMTQGAVSLGNGVMDIADVVANTGMAVGRAVAVTKRLTDVSRLALTAGV